MSEWHTCEHCYTSFPEDMLEAFETTDWDCRLVWLCGDCAMSLEEDAPLRSLE